MSGKPQKHVHKINNCPIAASKAVPGSSLDADISALNDKLSTKKDRQDPVASPDADGSGIAFIDTLSQDTNGKITVTKKNVQQASTSSAGIVQLSSKIDSTSETMAATPKAVHDAIIEAEQATVAGLNAENTVPDGHYITSVNETDGIVSITTATMDDVPTQDSTKPVKSGGVFASIGAETIEREAADDRFQQLIPTAASPDNKLADKAYVDAIGERVEARYLSYSQDGLPFPTYDDFEAAQQTDTFYYMNALTVPNNNDVIVITADGKHLNENGQPTTTRWRFFKPETGPGGWRYEYTINNSALSKAQLLAINSGINVVKVENYDAHLIDHNNPHQVTAAQVGLGNVDNTADLDKPISTATQTALDGKADNVVGGTANHIVVLGDNGKTLVDSHAAITSSYDGADEINPVTGSAVAAAIGELDAGPFGGEGKYIVSVSEAAGVVTATEGTLDAEPTENSTNPVKSGGVHQHLSTKADKDTDAVEDNVAVFDGNGNPVDSGISKGDLEEAIASAGSSVQGVSIDGMALTPGANNVVDIPLATTSADGAMGADDKAKLDGIASGAEVNVQADWDEADSTSDAFIQNKPNLATVATTGEYGDLLHIPTDLVHDASYVHTDNNYTAAEKEKLSGIESGAEANVQSDWTESDGNSDAYIRNKPENLVQDADYVHTDNNYTTAEKEKIAGIEDGAEVNVIETVKVDDIPLTVTDKTVNIDLSGKANKAVPSAKGNLAGLDANGNLIDSGKSYSDLEGTFKTRQTAKVSPTASGNALSFIDTVSQDENGEITATKKTVTVDSTYSSAGTNPVNGKAVAAAIGTLDVNDISGFGAGKTLATLTETDGKIAATFQDIEITKSQVSDFPTEMNPSSHTHGNITNDGKIGTTAGLGIVTGTGGTVTTKDFTQASPTTGPDTTTEFISTVAQGSDGAISATKKAITPASTSAAGIVQLSSSTSSSSETMAATPKAVSDLAASLGAGKADKVSEATEGNFAGLDSNGNLTDSGKKASDFATAAQGSKADTAIQGVKVNGAELTKDSLNKVDITAVTGVKGSSESTYRTGQVSITAGNVGAYTTAETDAALALKEDAANKKQTVNTSSTTEFPSSAAVAAFVNSSIATATANFLGNYMLTDLGLAYPATNAQIEGALETHTWPAGVTPTNNDYVIVSISSTTDPATGEPIIDEYRRFKYNDGESSWAYEYTLNNSSFTSAQWGAINSGITAGDKSAYDDHLADTSNPHSVTAAQVGLGNVDNTADIDKPISTATQAALDDKVDKVYTATENHIAVFDNAGNIKDSGKTYSDMQGEFKRKQTAKSSPTASGNTLSFIDTVSQDAEGVITATKKSVTVDSTYSSSGTNPVNGKAIKAAIDGLDAAITSNDGTNVQVKVTETDGKISAVSITSDNTENRNNKVSSWQTTPDNAHYPTEKLVKDSLDGKVDKVEGKGLSTEDYTTAEKTKLAGIAAGAEVNQNAFSNVKVGSTTVAADSKADTLELASSSAITLTPDAANDKVTIGVSTMGAASSSAAGTAGIVPAPGAGKQASFLRGDGTWVVPTNTDTLVKATAKTDNVNYKILATASASPTSGNATEAVYDTDISLNPSTNTITSNISGNAATATKPAVTTLTASDNLNNVGGSTDGDVLWYKWASGSAPANVPIAGSAVMEVVRTHSNKYITQTVYTTDHSVYRRECINGTWGSWYAYSKSTHTHGNITSGGALQTTDVAIANGDKLVITDASDSNKVARSSTAFDGSTITKALTQKGTFESVVLADALSATDGVKITYSGSNTTISGNFEAGAGVSITYADNVATFSADISAIPLATIYALS